MHVTELARLTRISTDTIRYYTRIGLLNPEREENGYRYYSQTDIQRVSFIRACRDLCLPLAKIKHCMQLLEQGEMAISIITACLVNEHNKECEKKDELEENIRRIQKVINHLPGYLSHDGDLEKMTAVLQQLVVDNT
jgi:DNA-binding transcriptional MerR regulator